MSKLNKWLVTLAGVSFSLSSAVAYAIDVEQIDPGRVGDEFLELDQLSPEIEPTLAPYGSQAEAKGGGDTFVLNGVHFDGATVFNAAELKTHYEANLNKKVNIAALRNIANSVTRRYHNAGFTLSRALLIPQKVRNGIVTIAVHEGSVAQITLSSKNITNSTFIKEYAQNVYKEIPTREITLMRYLSLISDMPGVQVKDVHYTFIGEGRTRVDLYTEHRAFGLYGELDNVVDKLYGPMQVTAAIAANQTCTGGRTQLLTLHSTNTERLKFYHLEHEQLVGGEGFKFQIAKQLVKVKPHFFGDEAQFNPNNIRATAHKHSLTLLYPYIRSQQRNLYLRGQFDIDTVDVKQDSGASVEFKDKTRALRLGIDYEDMDHIFGNDYFANNVFGAQLSKGFNIFGAHKTPEAGDKPFSRLNGRPDFTKLNLDYERLQRLHQDIYLKLDLGAQLAFNQLLSSEEFGVGGDIFGRGYDSAVIVGEHALAMMLELGHDSHFSGPYFQHFRKYIYYDIGSVWNKNSAQQTNGKKATASSAGIGALLNVYQDVISLRMELGKPLSRESNRGTKGAKFFFRLVGVY